MTDSIRDLLPSERADAEAQAENKLKELAASQAAMLREDFTRTFQTEHGKRVLAWLAERCGWGVPPLSVDTHKNIDPLRTTHNAMELSLYLAIRKYISIDVLHDVEYGFIKPSGTIDNTENVNRKAVKSTKTRKKG